MALFHRRKYFKHLNFPSLNECITTSINLRKTYVNKSPIFAQLKNKEIQRIDPVISVPRVIRFLQHNNCKFIDGFTCVSISCVRCCDKKEGEIYINKTTGYFSCKDCEDRGDWTEIQNRIKNLKITKKLTDESNSAIRKVLKSKLVSEYETKWAELQKTCKHVSSLSKEDINKIFSTFGLQVVDDSIVLNEFNALYDDAQKILHFPLLNFKKHVVGIKQLFADGTELNDPLKQCQGVLRIVPDKVKKKHDKGILVSNIKDLIALWSVKHYHVICLPHGITMLPQEILPLLEQYKRLVFWFGHDTANLNATRMFSEKLIKERCFFITTTDERPSNYVAAKNVAPISKVCDSAKPMVDECITTFAELRKEIWNELTNSDDCQGLKWRRFPALNDILKGHRRGELTILTGPTGSGKTTFISEYSLDLAQQGVSTLWGSFEIRNHRLASTMLQQLAMAPLTAAEHFEFWANEFEKLPIYFLKFHGPQSIETVMNVVNQAWYIHDIQHVIIDNLQFMIGLSLIEEKYMDRFYKQDIVIGAFRTFATHRNCHVTLIVHPRKERDTEELTISSIFGGAKASQEADNIMIIQKKMIETLHIKKYLQILKNRYTGDLGIMPLNFNKPTLSFGIKNTKLNKESAILEQCVNERN